MYIIIELVISVIIAIFGLAGIVYIFYLRFKEIDRYKALYNYIKSKKRR